MENFEDSVRRHKSSWDGFVSLLTWSAIGVVILMILMAIFLV